jgi:hypothetical protein
MALALLNTLPTNEFTPLIGCGLVYCLEEEEYELQAGVASFIPIVFNFFDSIFDGDVMVLHGETFTFTASAPTNANEILINGNFTALEVFNALNAYPFFADNYNITQPNQYEIHVQSDVLQLDNTYGFSENTTNVDSILINPFYPPLSITAGSNAIVKEDYIVFMDVFDVLAGEKKICSAAEYKPLSVFSNGTNKACFDVQKIIEDYGNIYSSPPAPLPTISSGANDWDWFEPNFLGQFRFRFYSKYKDPNGAGCQQILGTSITEPQSSGQRLYVVNMILEPDADYEIVDFSFFGAPSFPIRPITIHPDTYKFCTDTAWEWRVDLPVDLIQNVFGGLAVMVIRYYYTTGFPMFHLLNFSTNYDGVQIISINLGNTVPAPDPTRTLAYVDSDVYYSVLANPFILVATKRWYMELDAAKCCQCHKQFYFLSKLGNNETIIAKCDIKIDFEVEFFESCKDFDCGGTNFLDTAVFNGGNVPINLAKNAKLHTVVFECNEEDYLQAFLESPVKYIYENNKLYRIQQTANSYQIYQVNENRFLMEFQYKKSIDVVRRHFSQ